MLCFTFSFQIFFQSFLFAHQSSTSFLSYQFEAQPSLFPFFCPHTVLFTSIFEDSDWSRLYQLVMATHWLLCLRRRNAEQGIYLLLPSQAGHNTFLSRSSGKRRGILRRLCPPPWTKSPLLPLYYTCTSWLLQSWAALLQLLWVQPGGVVVKPDSFNTATPGTPREQLFSEDNIFCLMLFMDLVTLSTQPPICHQLKPLEVIHS